MKMIDKQNSALVLGMFETGLGVIRSLARNGIKVYGFDFKKDIAFYSRYVKARKCPHPLEEEQEFINQLIEFGKRKKHKPVLFITSDDFLIAVSRNITLLENYFLINMPNNSLIESIADKYQQYKLVQKTDINLPQTFIINEKTHITQIAETLNYPAFIKGLDVNSWRSKISGSVKGFEVNSKNDFVSKSNEIVEKGVNCIVQEIVQGPDTNHYKFCAYFSANGKMLNAFTLQKIRQNPIRFGVGSMVESIYNKELFALGEKLFRSINYVGVGSAEFKLDEKDGKFKLIEINARYWQQNILPTACGMNFPLTNYLDLTQKKIEVSLDFNNGIKWINIYMDFDSFLKYRKIKELSFKQWFKSIKGKKVFSDWSWDDPLPALYEIKFGWTLIKLPFSLIKRVLF